MSPGEMNPLAELAVSVLLVAGGTFLLIGSYALVKLPDTLQRLHGPTKSTTLGVGSVLIASMLYFLFAEGTTSIHELLITLFLFLTAPVAANLVAKAHMRNRAPKSNPTDQLPG